MNVISAVGAVFLLLLLGYAAKKLGALKSSDASIVNSLVINLTGPAFIFTAIHGKPLTMQMVRAPIIVFISSMLVLAAAWAAGTALRLDRRTTGGLMIAAAFGNTGFLGYPVIFASFPGNNEAIATAVMIDQFAMAMPLFSVGVAVAAIFASAEVRKSQMLEFLRAPLFIAVILAVVLRSTPLPALLTDSVRTLGAATVPLAMISLGLSLSRKSLKSAGAPLAVALVLKMVLLPILAYIGLVLLGTSGTVLRVSVVEASMPTAVMSSVIAGRYGANESFVSAATFVMTLASIVVIPLSLTLLG